MHKILYLFLLSLCINAGAQEESAEPVRYDSAYSVDTSSTFVKRGFETKLTEKYNGSEFDYEQRAIEKTMWQRFLEWLGALLRNLFQFSNPQESVLWAMWIARIIASAIIIFVVYLIAKALLKKEGQWIFGKDGSRKIINYEGIEKNLRAADFEKLISETVAAGDLRLVIRYYYLWLLKRLTEAGQIEWDVEKTNSDYLSEIRNPALKDEFSYLSYLYNYIWYGEFTIDAETFEKSKTAFERAIKSVR